MAGNGGKWRFLSHRGTPKSSISMGFSLQNHPSIHFWAHLWKPPNCGHCRRRCRFLFHGFSVDGWVLSGVYTLEEPCKCTGVSGANSVKCKKILAPPCDFE